jgi:hypothetical protein
MLTLREQVLDSAVRIVRMLHYGRWETAVLDWEGIRAEFARLWADEYYKWWMGGRPYILRGPPTRICEPLTTCETIVRDPYAMRSVEELLS